MQVRDPYIKVDIGRDRASLYIGQDTPVSRGVFEHIKDLLRKRMRSLAWFKRLGWLSYSYLLLMLLSTNVWSAWALNARLGAIILLFVLSILWPTSFLIDFPRSRIVASHRIRNPHFLERNKDKIILAAICAGIGAVATLFVSPFLAP